MASIIAHTLQEFGMWTCFSCRHELPYTAAKPEGDCRGNFFVCPICGRRNILFYIFEDNKFIMPIQPTKGWPLGVTWDL